MRDALRGRRGGNSTVLRRLRRIGCVRTRDEDRPGRTAVSAVRRAPLHHPQLSTAVLLGGGSAASGRRSGVRSWTRAVVDRWPDRGGCAGHRCQSAHGSGMGRRIRWPDLPGAGFSRRCALAGRVSRRHVGRRVVGDRHRRSQLWRWHAGVSCRGRTRWIGIVDQANIHRRVDRECAVALAGPAPGWCGAGFGRGHVWRPMSGARTDDSGLCAEHCAGEPEPL